MNYSTTEHDTVKLITSFRSESSVNSTDVCFIFNDALGILLKICHVHNVLKQELIEPAKRAKEHVTS